MNLRNSYQYQSDCCCGVSLIKQKICTVKQSSSIQKQETSQIQLDKKDNTTLVPISGRLYRNTYWQYCCVCLYIPYPNITYELQGYRTKLSQTKTNCCYGNTTQRICGFHFFYCCDLPQYFIQDSNNRRIGDFQQYCCVICCPELTVNSQYQLNAFKITPKHVFCCSEGWEAKDQSMNIVARFKNTGCCGVKMQLKFLRELTNSDKILLMSAIPFLP